MCFVRVFVCVSCQTEQCEECEYQGHSRAVGDRWKGSNCQLCHCLPNLKVQCAPFCPYTTTGCPQVCLCVILKQTSFKWLSVHLFSDMEIEFRGGQQMVKMCVFLFLLRLCALFLQGQTLIPGGENRCCYCEDKGNWSECTTIQNNIDFKGNQVETYCLLKSF